MLKAFDCAAKLLVTAGLAKRRNHENGSASSLQLRRADRERQLRRHLSDKLVLIEPADPIVSVGLNPLELDSPDFVRIAEFAEVLKRRWSLDHFGARTASD